MLLFGQVEIGDESQRVFHGLLAELMYVQFAALPVLDGDGKGFRFESCAVANLACLGRHECSNAIARELALGLLVKPLHLGHESFKWFRDFLFAIAAKLHFNRLTIRAEIKSGFESFRQIGKRHVFVHVEVFD